MAFRVDPSNYSWGGNLYENVNRIINECKKLTQKEWKSMYDRVGMVIYRELCKIWYTDRCLVDYKNYKQHETLSIKEITLPRPKDQMKLS